VRGPRPRLLVWALGLALSCASPEKSREGESPAATVELARGLAETSVPFELFDNRILVRAMINGQGPFTLGPNIGAPYQFVPVPSPADSFN
jgi:hypothetical protein